MNSLLCLVVLSTFYTSTLQAPSFWRQQASGGACEACASNVQRRCESLPFYDENEFMQFKNFTECFIPALIEFETETGVSVPDVLIKIDGHVNEEAEESRMECIEDNLETRACYACFMQHWRATDKLEQAEEKCYEAVDYDSEEYYDSSEEYEEGSYER